MSEKRYVAFDLGADSGRVIVGRFDGKRLALDEVHRFPTGATAVPTASGRDQLCWDALRFWNEMKLGLAKCAKGGPIAGMGVDTWGVDFALLDEAGVMLGNPVQYRDARTNGMMERAFELAGREEIFELTGIQFIYINSLYQLLSLAESKSASLEKARTFLMMPALFNYWLCGSRTCEFTIATTSQCYDPRAKGWAAKMLETLGIPTGIFPKVVPPGTVLGKLNGNVAKETGLGKVPVIAPACHDTGSAVAAVPARDKGRAYISSGTWSLVGVEVAEPVITRQSRALNFTNEGGVCGTFWLLKNVTGLWLLQECRRAWMAEGEKLEYADLTEMASRAPESKALLDPDDASFAAPGDMPKRIAEYFARAGKPVPQDRAATVRCILDSLAAKYCDVVKSIETLTGSGVNEVVIVGGGSKNGLLNQLTADRLGKRVLAGPVEATAIGNVLMQMLALGDIASLDEGRRIVGESFEVKEYEPRKA